MKYKILCFELLVAALLIAIARIVNDPKVIYLALFLASTSIFTRLKHAKSVIRGTIPMLSKNKRVLDS